MITKAPWIIKGQDIIGNEPNGYICTWSGKIANAQAISCVPELLEALQATLTCLTTGLCENCSINCPENSNLAIDKAKSALKRAGIEVGR